MRMCEFNLIISDDDDDDDVERSLSNAFAGAAAAARHLGVLLVSRKWHRSTLYVRLFACCMATNMQHTRARFP